MIQIMHPNGMTGSLPPENVFLVKDEMNQTLGTGSVLCLHQPNLYPDCPLNIYFSLQSQPAAQCLLFGALMARAQQLRCQGDTTLPARVYTAVAPNDMLSQNFYTSCGMTMDDAEDIIALQMPVGDGRIPMSCSVVRVPACTGPDMEMLLKRFAANDINWITPEYLANAMRQPHYLHLQFYRNQDLIGEALLTGLSGRGELISMYIIPPMRRQGMAKTLLHRALAIMATEGITEVNTRVMRRSIPQVKLVQAFSGMLLGSNMLYVGKYL